MPVPPVSLATRSCAFLPFGSGAGGALLEPCHQVDGVYVERQLGSHLPDHCDASYRRAIADTIGVIDALNGRRSVNGPLLDALRRQLQSLTVERSEASGQ